MQFQEVGNGLVVGIREMDGTLGLCGIWKGFRYPEGGVYLEAPVPNATVPIETLLAAFELARSTTSG